MRLLEKMKCSAPVSVFCGFAFGAMATTQAISQSDDTYCGATGPMIVSFDPIPDDIRHDAYVFATGDEGASAIIEANGLTNNLEVSDRDFYGVVTGFGSAAVLSSAAEANRLLPGLDCARFHVLSLG